MDNPYLDMYKSLNIFDADKPLNKIIAHNLSLQLAMLHQTLGIVMKDVVKALSVQFDIAPNTLTVECSKTGHKDSVSPSSLSAKNSKKGKMPKPSTQVRSDQTMFSKRHFAIPSKSPSVRISQVTEDIEEANSASKQNAARRDEKSKERSESKSKKLNQKLKKTLKSQPKIIVQEEQKSKGVSCNMCQRFYEATGIVVNDDSQACSRHRAAVAPSKVPSFTQHFEI